MTDASVHGTVAAGLEAVRDAFAANFNGIEVGASLCVVRDGEVVIDLWGGHTDRKRTHPWQRDTLVNIYSSTKGLSALVIARLVGEGRLDYAERVASYWPEFAENGKQDITVAQLLSHQAGLAGLREPVTVQDLYDHDAFAARLAAAEPLWEPGTAVGYHAITWGHLAAELAQRVTGETLGTLFSRWFAEPLQADVWIGLPHDQHHRVAEMLGPNHARLPDGGTPETGDLPPAPPLYMAALANPVIRPFKDVCTAEWRSAEVPAANGQANGRGMAVVYGAVAAGQGGDALQQALPAATREVVGADVEDLALGRGLRRSAGGFILNNEGQYGPSANAYGHGGAGGSLGFADPDARIGFGYAMNQMQPGIVDDSRAQRLVDALYQAL